MGGVGVGRVRNRAGAQAGILLILSLTTCSGDSGGPLGPGGDPNAVLECDRVGYPCAMSSIPIEVLRRSDVLADSAAAMLRNGTSTPQVRSWLEQREGVAEASGDGGTLRFRVTGGAPVWVFDDARTAGNVSASTTATAPSIDAVVVQSEVAGDGSDERRALVLSPFAWQFTGIDDAPIVAGLLNGTRGFEGRVQLMAAATQTSAPLPLSLFKSWENFDVVHVSSHGITKCEDGVCRAMLSVAIDNRPIEQVKADWGEPGVTFMVGSESGDRYISITADFFRDNYPAGVGNTLVYLSACQTLTSADTDLADVIRGSKGVVVGWSEAVQIGPGMLAAAAFYKRLAEDGVTARTAHADIGALAVNHWSDGKGQTFHAMLRVTDRKEGGDLRIRDIVWLENPAGGAPLSDNDIIAIRGMPGDGAPDTIPFRIRVDGLDAPPADFTIRVEIGGVAAAPLTLAGAQPAGDRVRVLTGMVAMGRDVQDGEELELSATVELPDRGTSRASATITVSGDPGYWVGKAIFIRETEDTQEVAESLDLRFDYNPDLDRYDLTSGTLTWYAQGVSLGPKGEDCRYTHGPLPIILPPGSAFLSISNDFTPARYTVHGSYEGPVTTIPTSCPGVTRPMKFHAVWLRTSNGVNEVQEGGNLIEGFYEEDFGFLFQGWAWVLERRTGS